MRGFVLSWVCLTAAIAGCGSTDAGEGPSASAAAPVDTQTYLPPAGGTSDKPSVVPDDYVITPNGYFHPSCVIQLAQGDVIDGDGNVVHHDGTKLVLPGCGHPSYDHQGHVRGARVTEPTQTDAQPTDAPPPTVNGWVASAWSTTAGAMRADQAVMLVPANPAMNANQTIYYFPGLEPLATGDTILQPVLGYVSGHWRMSSWNCCKNGYTWSTSWVDVNPNDQIAGIITGSSCSGNVCSSWSVTAQDWASGQSTTLETTSYGEVLNWTMGATLEAYNVQHCALYPASGSMQFSEVAAEEMNGAWYWGPWSNQIYSTSPSCGQSIASATQGYVTISTYPTTMGTYAQPTGCGTISAGRGLRIGESFSSCDGRFTLAMQFDGNLVLYWNGHGALWSTNTAGTDSYEAVMQSDGNFVLYDQTSKPRWASNTANHSGAYLAVQTDGNLVVYQNGYPLWSSHTCCH